ncbi:MAG: hypothetical protein JO278_00950, partial [Dyella sp.]|nr:hypothetical protein [Dyella sp.]
VDLAITGAVTDPTGITLRDTGAITETTGFLSTARLTGTASSATLGNANTVTTLDTFTTATGFLLNDTTGLDITGVVSAPAGAVTLNVSGALTETGGIIVAGTLVGSATSASLMAQNTIDTLGSFSTTTSFVLADVAPLLVTGPVDPTSIVINDTQSITLDGNLTATDVALIAQQGGITQIGGVLTADRLTSNSAGNAQYGGAGAVALVNTLGNATVGNGTFVLVDSQALTVGGPLTAPFFQIAASGQITLAGTTITTTGAPLAAQRGATPFAAGSGFQVLAVNGFGSFVQTGVATIRGLDGTTATVRIDVPAAGTILLGDLQAPQSDIILASPGGTLLGDLFARNLLVIGTTGSSNLFGSIQGVSTPGAAALGQIEPAINGNYLFNGCVIASPVCGALTGGGIGGFPPTATLLLPSLSIEDLQTVLSDSNPPTLQRNGSPTQNVDIVVTFPPTLPGETNPEVVLPNVSGRDY